MQRHKHLTATGRHVIGFAVVLASATALVLRYSALAHPAARARSSDQVPTEADMKPYVETIPGTDVKFEMLPIPGGKFMIGSPSDEAKRHNDEGPQCEVT